MDITRLTAEEIREKIEKKEVSALEVTRAHLDRIREIDGDLNAFITITEEEALEAAKRVDQKVKNGEKLGKLAGIPVGVKDNIVTKAIRTTAGSKMLENFIPPYDATVIKRIKEEDGIILGKTNLDEFAGSYSTESSYFGPTKNPIDKERVPGGSSGGSTAAVRAHEVALALGSDTGGSNRQPASYCGIVGIKPSYGLVSRYGLIPLSNSLDVVGTFGRNVKDATLLLDVIAGSDINDPSAMEVERVNYLESLQADIKGMRIALPGEYMNMPMDSRVKEKVLEAARLFEKLGAKVEEVSLPHAKYAWATYYLIVVSEISSAMAKYGGVGYGYRTEDYETLDELYIKSRTEGLGEEIKRSIMAGTYILSSQEGKKYYEKAFRVRALIKEDFDRVFETYDVILSPTTPNLPFKLGESVKNPTEMYGSGIFNIPANVAGLCAISVPCGYADGLPVGLQIMGDRFKEINILKAAYAFEAELSLGGEHSGI
ncbi:MAG: Asp-tRNA(Asn)/Glu-tRNA(Gln) amidotransferase subunit GatA [Tissierellia bacterium]|nr:Asp-tRNA(Asn)/Glu-tRNA(Gln) amidotransferase subunit GatA [Tissierellia bacterium]